VQHLALRRLPDELLQSGLAYLSGLFDDLPLCRHRHRNAQVLLQLFQPVERNAAAVLELRNHRTAAETAEEVRRLALCEATFH
jgi:hypothetical protein